MKKITRLHGLFIAVSALVATGVVLPNSSAQIQVPQLSPYTSDADTLLLEHFDGGTGGSPNGSVTYANGVFGQGVHLDAGSWTSWNLGALSQGTVEFWCNYDAFTGNDWPVRSALAPFVGCTFMTGTDGTFDSGTDGFAYHVGYQWASTTVLVASPVITEGSWHHYACTWGNEGERFYVDGMLVATGTDTSGQNSATTWWCIGGQSQDGPGFGLSSFSGTIDELRISDIQRDFVSVIPEPSAAVLTLGGIALLLARRRTAGK